MAQDVQNVRIAFDGAVYFAPSGTTLPTDAVTAILTVDPTYKELGLLSEDGITTTPNETWQNIKAWQRGQVVRKIRTEEDIVTAIGMLEENPVTLEIYHGNYSAGGVLIGGQPITRGVWVFDSLDGDYVTRKIYPDGQVTARQQVVETSDGAKIYPVEVTGYPYADAPFNGAQGIEYRAITVSSS